ncbi:MAG: hypothetical protein RMJ59_01640 [Candidatus Nitrosocaldus sp.]|nr:hypothetical protein [Candidatus Nitrosocaldus sp.]MDW8275068.1 hypothetical protein [Candidatus Nitrosocaldus sp.]
MIESTNNLNILRTLTRLRKIALRQGVWNKALSLHERMLVALSSKYIRAVRSTILAIVLARIVMKLKIALNDLIVVEQRGFARAYTWIKGAINVCRDMFHQCMTITTIEVPLINKNIIEWFTLFEASMISKNP